MVESPDRLSEDPEHTSLMISPATVVLRSQLESVHGTARTAVSCSSLLDQAIVSQLSFESKVASIPHLRSGIARQADNTSHVRLTFFIGRIDIFK